jgi:hypothetical protein
MPTVSYTQVPSEKGKEKADGGSIHILTRMHFFRKRLTLRINHFAFRQNA